MKGISYKNNGENIEIFDGEEIFIDRIFNDVSNDILLVTISNSFGFTLYSIENKELFANKVIEYEEKYNEINKIIFILNEIIVPNDEPFEELCAITNKKCYYLNYDMIQNNSKYKLFYPLSIYSQVDYLLDNGYLEAKNFLQKMNFNFNDLKKPFKLAFYSNHVSPLRIDIFNILKATDNLKNSTWSFNNSLLYYSNEKHNLDLFFKENVGLIPHSFDNYSETGNNIKHTYFSQFLTYFEISTENYIFRNIKEINNHYPITEKVVKPFVTCLPFIFFGPRNSKKCFEDIGMTFKSPLYGFYDICDDNSIREGIGHVTQQTIMDINEIHEIYFKYVDEYNKNCDIFINYLIKIKNGIIDEIGDKTKNKEWIQKKLI
jgi:hypothetical protein